MLRSRAADASVKPIHSLQQETVIRYPLKSSGDQTAAASTPITAEMLRIFLPNKSYKTLQVNPEDTAGTVCANFSSRFAMSLPPSTLQLTEVTRMGRRRLDNEQPVLVLKRAWPTIFGESSNYFFEIGLSSSHTDQATVAFRRLMYGSA